MNLKIRNEIEKILNAKIRDYSLIPTYSNQLFRVDVSRRIFYCKIFTNPQDYHLCEKTEFFLNFLKNKLIPCPEVICSYYPKKNQTLELHPFVLLSELPGDDLKTLLHLNDESLYSHPEKLNRIYENFGQFVGLLHSYEFTEFGELIQLKNNPSEFIVGPIHSISPSVVEKGPFKYWSLHFKEVLNFRLSQLNHPIMNEIKHYLEKFIENELSKKYCKNIVPRLCHGDLNKKNIFIEDEKISGVIDPDDCFIGNCEEDLMRLELDHFSEHPELRDVFYEGYKKHTHLDKDFEKRRPLLYISRLLVGAMCVLKFNNKYSSNIEEDLKIARNNMMQVISQSMA